MRVTTTDSDSVDEMIIEDAWDGKSPGDHRPLSDDISPEMWSTMSRKQKERAVEAWEAKRAAIERARAIRSQPPAATAGRDPDDDEPPLQHRAGSPGISATVRGATLREHGESPCLPFLLSPCALAKPSTHGPDPPQPHSDRWVYDLLEQLA